MAIEKEESQEKGRERVKPGALDNGEEDVIANGQTPRVDVGGRRALELTSKAKRGICHTQEPQVNEGRK